MGLLVPPISSGGWAKNLDMNQAHLIDILRDRSRPQCAEISGSYVRFISWQESGEIPNMLSWLSVCRYELLRITLAMKC